MEPNYEYHDVKEPEAYGYRMVVFVIYDRTKPGNIDLRTDLVLGTLETCQEIVNRVLSIYPPGKVYGWKITDLLPLFKK